MHACIHSYFAHPSFLPVHPSLHACMQPCSHSLHSFRRFCHPAFIRSLILTNTPSLTHSVVHSFMHSFVHSSSLSLSFAALSLFLSLPRSLSVSPLPPHASIHPCLHTYVLTYLHTRLPACMHPCMQACMNTHMYVTYVLMYIKMSGHLRYTGRVSLPLVGLVEWQQLLGSLSRSGTASMEDVLCSHPASGCSSALNLMHLIPKPSSSPKP